MNADVLRQFVEHLRGSYSVGQAFDPDHDGCCGYCSCVWDVWSREHHSEWCVFGEKLTAALQAPAAREGEGGQDGG